MTKSVVLAAGYASRVGTNKMALPIEGTTVLVKLVQTLQEVVEEIIVVTGHYHQSVTELVGGMDKVRICQNTNYADGMFSSIIRGIKEVDEDCFILPGDYPLICKETFEKLLASDGVIRVPVYEKRRGHPIFIEKKLIETLKKEPITSNLKAFRDRHEVTYIDVDDRGILLDIDTMKDYDVIKKEVEGCRK